MSDTTCDSTGNSKQGGRMGTTERQRLAPATMVELLIDETGKLLRRDANVLGKQIELRRRAADAVPNWDANCGIVNPTILRAFGAALRKLKVAHDVDWLDQAEPQQPTL